MVSKTKVYDFIRANLKKLEKSWTEELEALNIWDDVSDLYCISTDIKNGSFIPEYQANTILAFIVMAYDNRSEFLEPHKDRYDNKVKILTRLAGPAALNNSIFNNLVYSLHDDCNKVINWYIDYQRDWRWKDVLVSREYAAKTMARVMNGEIDAGKMLNESREMNTEADRMLDILRTEFLNLDTALDKEQKPKITDFASINFMSHEAFIRNREKKREQQKIDDEVKKSQAKNNR